MTPSIPEAREVVREARQLTHQIRAKGDYGDLALAYLLDRLADTIEALLEERGAVASGRTQRTGRSPP